MRLGQAPSIDSKLFVRRALELYQMREALQPGGLAQEQRRLVLAGAGGIGKTQLTIAFARCHRNVYDSIFWLDATSEAMLKKAFNQRLVLCFREKFLKKRKM